MSCITSKQRVIKADNSWIMQYLRLNMIQAVIWLYTQRNTHPSIRHGKISHVQRRYARVCMFLRNGKEKQKRNCSIQEISLNVCFGILGHYTTFAWCSCFWFSASGPTTLLVVQTCNHKINTQISTTSNIDSMDNKNLKIVIGK